MRAAATQSVRANGCEIRFSRTRRGNGSRPPIPENLADRLELIRLFVSIAAKNADFDLKHGTRFVINPTLLTRPYRLMFHEALTSFCGRVEESIINAAQIFADNENVTRLAREKKGKQHDGFQGIEIQFGLKRGQVTFKYEQVDGDTRTIGFPETILI
ncbi:hypothetical protein HZC35_05730 [Candidatus Saganbacteria bacterium]|nr:hypothetical protein [Candidatus Saganbacteria bacterium]